MMVVGIGTDIIRISRVRRLVKRFPRRIGGKIYTPGELSSCTAQADSAPSLAGKFAAKEAVLKALGTGWSGGARFIEVEIVDTPAGSPAVRLQGKTAAIAHARGITRWHVSISHDGDLALAVVLAESED